jgi:2-amino-4-hydroxy-6-hydroxymethyldihydropteridine diphosphokinase
MNQNTHRACLLVGSNIDPVVNTQKAIYLLSKNVKIISVSTTWETEAVGSRGPNFLNTALICLTELSADQLKEQALKKIENKMGRIRNSDKNAPRTIDLDIVLYDDRLIDTNLWSHLYMALTISELLPDLSNPQTNDSLEYTAQALHLKGWAKPHPEITIYY